MLQRKKKKPGRLLLGLRHNKAWSEDFSIVMQLGLTMAGCIFFCFFIGRMLDKFLGTRGIFLTIFIFLGIIGGANVAYRQIMEIVTPVQRKTKPSGHQ